MSLPPATRILSDHPPKNAVTEPIDTKRLHEDLDKKLRLYGVLQAFRSGKLPDNIQVDETLRYMMTHSPVDIDALSPDGANLVEDIRAVISTAREMVKEKNADELLQKFIWHTRGVEYSPANMKRPLRESTAMTVDKAKADSQEAAHHLRTLLSLLITNAEARKMLSDFSVIGRDLLVKSADLLRPNEEALQQVDEPVSSEQPTFAPKESTGLPRAEEIMQRNVEERDGLKQGVNVLTETRQEVETVGQDIQAAEDSQTKRHRAKAGIANKWSGLKEQVPSEYRERAEGQFNRARDFLKDEYFPKERRERFIFRAKKIVLECQKDKSYQESIKWFLSVLPQYGHEGLRTVPREKGNWKHGEFELAVEELKTLLTRFANGTSPQPAVDSFKRIMRLTKEDNDMRRWVGGIQDWMRRILLEPGYVVDAQCERDGKAIREEGRQFYDEKYKSQFDDFFNAVRTWCTALTKDPLNKQFGEDWARLTHHLLFNSDGRLAWKPHLWADIHRVIVPQLVDKVGYLPIPRVEFSDQNMDLVIENLTLSGRNLFPNIVSVEVHNYAKFSPYKAIQDETRHHFVIKLGQIQADLRDVMFYFNKKTGVPKIHDSGLADVLLGGNGITSTIHLHSAPRGSGSLFFVRSVKVKVDTLKFRIRDSHHDAMYKFLGPIAIVAVKRQIRRALADSIKNVFEMIDQLLVKVRDRMDETKLKEGETKGKALKDFVKQSRERSDKRPKAAEGHLNLVPKKNSLLLPNIGNPNSWFRKQQQEDQIATEGHEWRSKAFTIVPNATPASHVEAPLGSASMQFRSQQVQISNEYLRV